MTRTRDFLENIRRQLPAEEGDVFDMALSHERPSNDYCYMNHIEPTKENTVTVSLRKDRYPTKAQAEDRAAELFKMRNLKPYKAFQTVNFWCWYTVGAE